MSIEAVEILHNEVSGWPSLGLDRQTRDALATYVKLRWPTHTAKAAAREWDLSLDEAKGVVAGRTSLAALDRIWKHKRGGWAVLLPVMGAVIGHTIDDHIRKEREAIRHARESIEAKDERLRALADHLRLVPRSAPVDGPELGSRPERRRPGVDR